MSIRMCYCAKALHAAPFFYSLVVQSEIFSNDNIGQVTHHVDGFRFYFLSDCLLVSRLCENFRVELSNIIN